LFQEIIIPQHREREMEETKSIFKRVCVFCGSSSGKKASYQEAAVELGKELVTLKSPSLSPLSLSLSLSLITFFVLSLDHGSTCVFNTF
jgi:NAD(P)H-hydrate repair Nnr-like enzyme with NAD(P)H-hydrate dehydratase domain